jgi:hypothetical protein
MTSCPPDPPAAEFVQAVALEEAELRRKAAVVPTDPAELVDFFLNCDAADMEYFVAMVRSRLDGAFFAAIDNAIGQERFVEEPNEDALAELEGLRAYVRQTMQAQDAVKKGAHSLLLCVKCCIRSVGPKNVGHDAFVCEHFH